MTKLTSRERMLRALNREETDYIPCCFMNFAALRQRVNEDLYALVEAEQEMGLDSLLFIPVSSRAQRPEHHDLRGLPVRYGPEMHIREWRETRDSGFDALHREYQTPDGLLTTSVRLSEDWPHGDRIPLLDDFLVPRAEKNLVTVPEDLAALQHLLNPPTDEDLARFRAEAETARVFAAKHGVILAGGWGVSVDMLSWLCGIQNLMVLVHEQPRMVADLLEMVHVWNRQRMEAHLSPGLDLYIRRAWYEGCDFVTRSFFRDEVLPRLKAEVDLAHDKGAKFGYICTSGLNPMLDYYLEAGIDVLIGIDPVQGRQTDMALVKRRVGDKICLWGGVSGAVTVEMGNEEDVRSAVREAIGALGPSGFILSPIDNVTIDAPRTWRNLESFLDEWRKNRRS